MNHFWRKTGYSAWFNQGLMWELLGKSTETSTCGADGSKAFDIQTDPTFDAITLTRELELFSSFPSFWGPAWPAYVRKFDWTIGFPLHQPDKRGHAADLTLGKSPHLDYEPQRRAGLRDEVVIVMNWTKHAN